MDSNWQNPKEGFSEEHENGEVDTDEISFGIQSVDRLMSAIGEKVMLPILGTLVQKCWQTLIGDTSTQQSWPSHKLVSMLMMLSRLNPL